MTHTDWMIVAVLLLQTAQLILALWPSVSRQARSRFREETRPAPPVHGNFEILDSAGKVRYTRPAGHPDWQEALDTPGLYVRTEDGVVMSGHQGKTP